MKRTVFLVYTLIGILMILDVSAQRGKKVKLENSIDSVSYALGVNIANSLQQQKLTGLNIEKISKALEDVLDNQELKLSLEQSQTLLNDYISVLQAELKLAEMKKMAAFLDENKKDPEVVTLPSGLQYKVLKQGEGISPIRSNKVKVHYKGALMDGTVFDSSYDIGEPIVLGVSQVIKGWQEALVLMKPGAKWMLYIPPYLGYGERGTASIPANSVLIFEVELLSIE